MEGGETKVGGDGKAYGDPPWRFKGRAVYQLHLVNSQVARALIPKELRLVQAFGYTLGGFFLANYDDSPAGVFEELVVIAGIVWNPPTSCAWASKVLVNSTEACLHGRKDVGLPSSFARFSKVGIVQRTWVMLSYSPELKIARRQNTGPDNMLGMIGSSSTTCSSRFQKDTQVTQIDSSFSADDIFSINLASPMPKENSEAWLGPVIKMSLPSFSGRTEDNPDLVKYTCQMECRVRITKPLQVFKASPTIATRRRQQECEDQSCKSRHEAIMETSDKRSELSICVMLSRPILALEFNCLNMNVEAPLVISP